MDLDTDLFDLIESVTHAKDERTAQVEMLSRLLRMFNLDQAVLCQLEEDGVKNIFALDRTKRIIHNLESLWISRNIIEQSLEKMVPLSFQEDLSNEYLYTRSVHEYSLKNILCLPLDQGENLVVYLASQRVPDKKFSDDELKHAHIASKSCSLALDQFRHLAALKEENDSLQKSLDYNRGGFIYCSKEIDQLMEEISKIAPFNISTFLSGESGTGKEELAKEIHLLSGRTGPFVPINCANLTETLLESELFGYSKGAFTGAIKDKKGLFLEADKGTLFLDEIAEIPFALQAKLLRAIQERKIRPLGSNKDISIDIRIISASHKDLLSAISKCEFREDLFYRLNEISFNIPALRNRIDDIELLAKQFINNFCNQFNIPQKTIAQDAIEALKKYAFPGNVRELKNLCRSAVILSAPGIIEAKDIRLPITAAELKKPTTHKVQASFTPKLEEVDINDTISELNLEGKSLRDIRKQYDQHIIETLMKKRNLTQEEVASELSVSVRTIQRLISDQPTN